MESLTLEELKRQNAEEEAKRTGQQQEEVETEEEAEEADEVEAVDEAETEEETEPEPWMKVEDQDSEDQPKEVPLKAHVKAVKKLKGRVKERDDENQALKSEIEELRKAIQTRSIKTDEHEPRYEDFAEEDDPQLAYLKARQDWMLGQLEAKHTSTADENRLKEEARRKRETIEKTVDQHYDRAEKLISTSGIAPEAYQEADARVRQAIDAVREGQGDGIADQMISILGDGSEKVFYYLGVNDAAIAQLQSKLTVDPSGLSAIAYLTEIKATKTARQRKQSQAAKPAPDVKGDSKPVNRSEKALKKAYNSEKSAQKRFEIRQEGRSAGYNVNEW